MIFQNFLLKLQRSEFCLIAAEINIIKMGSCGPGQCFKQKEEGVGISKQAPLLKKSQMKGLVNVFSTGSLLKTLKRGELVADSLFQQLHERQIIRQDTSIRMIFRGSEHKFSAEQFHRRCNGAKNTILIVLTANKHIFGAFTPCEWKKGEIYCYQKDDKNVSFIFRVNNQKIQLYPLQEQSKDFSIMNDDECGPIFGKGHDLMVNDRCDIRLNWSNLGSSYYCKFKFGSPNANELLCGEQRFKIKQYEIWELRSLL